MVNELIVPEAGKLDILSLTIDPTNACIGDTVTISCTIKNNWSTAVGAKLKPYKYDGANKIYFNEYCYPKTYPQDTAACTDIASGATWHFSFTHTYDYDGQAFGIETAHEWLFIWWWDDDKASEPIASSVSLTPSSYSIYIGDTVNFTVYRTPAGTGTARVYKGVTEIGHCDVTNNTSCNNISWVSDSIGNHEFKAKWDEMTCYSATQTIVVKARPTSKDCEWWNIGCHLENVFGIPSWVLYTIIALIAIAIILVLLKVV